MPTGTNARGATVPKYASTFTAAGFPVSMIDFRGEGHCLCYSPCDAATDTTIVANADVARLPDNLDANLTSGQVTAISNHLEARNIPADWVSIALTWRQLIRDVVGLFQFIQRYKGLGGPGPIFGGSVTLTTTFSQLPLAARNALVAAANSFGYDTSALTGASTVRQILNAMRVAWAAQPINIGITI